MASTRASIQLRFYFDTHFHAIAYISVAKIPIEALQPITILFDKIQNGSIIGAFA